LKRSKKAPQIRHSNDLAIQHLEPHETIITIQQVDEAEVDEMWSFVEKKSHQRWLWHAIAHRTGKVLA
jgi:insertion element IS1 protein InsB